VSGDTGENMQKHVGYTDSPALAKIKQELAQCTGTEAYHRITTVPLPVTDGVQEFAEIAKAYWFIDLIASYQIGKTKNKPYQVWTLKVRDSQGEVVMQEDYGTPILIRQEIPYTDFPDGTFEVWIENGVALLPSEH